MDVLDQRKNRRSKVKFKIVRDVNLPFKENTFDLVISNHVIEHVKYQEKHLSEIKRVLKKEGICYLATPNRLFPWETHYKKWFVHYLGNERYNKYLKKNRIYVEDLYLLSYFQLKKLLGGCFNYKEYTAEIIKNPIKYGFRVPIISALPLIFIKLITPFSQTNVFVLKK